MSGTLRSPILRRSRWSNTSQAVDKLQRLLKCGLCKELVDQPFVVGSCEHMFCKNCINPFLGKFCPECKLPADAKEMQHDIVMTDIVTKSAQLTGTLARYSLRSKGVGEVFSPVKHEEAAPVPPQQPTSPTSPSKTLQLNGGRNKSFKKSPSPAKIQEKAPAVRKRGRPPGSHKNHISVDLVPKSVTSPAHAQLVPVERVRKRRGMPLSRGGMTGRGEKRHAPLLPPQPPSPVHSPIKKNAKLDSSFSPLGKKPGILNTSLTLPPGGFTLKRNSKGETPLHLATIKGDLTTVKDLLDQGANPNVKDNAGWTPLHEACHHGHLDLVELLLHRGALVNLPGFENETALHDAVVMNEHAIASILVGRGANKHARNSRGLTPMDLAVNCTGEMKKALKTPCSHNTDSNEMILNQQPQITTNVVLLGTGLDTKQQEDLQVCADILKGKVVTEFCDQVTHLITVCDDEGRCQRTLKFLQAILKGKWILNFTWVEECIAFNRRVFEEPFEIIGAKQHAMTFGPKHARTNGVNQFPPLFDGCSFYLDGNFVSPSLSKENLALLIRHGGGTVLTRDPRRHSLSTETKVIPYHAPSNGGLSNVHYFVVSQHGPAEIKDSVCCISSAWLVACISTFKLLPHSFEEK